MEPDVQEPLHEALRLARRAAGMTQVELAARANCKQSAISMFESGRPDVLSSRTVAAIAELLGVPVPAGDDGVRPPAELFVRKFCPTDECPANWPYVVRGELMFRPRLVEARKGEATRCNFCGEVLFDRCPNEACGALVEEGAFCRHCGTPYVPAARVMRGPVNAWAGEQATRIKEMRDMTRSIRFGA